MIYFTIPNEEAAKEVFKVLAKRDYNIILKDSDILNIWCDFNEVTNLGIWFLETKNQKLKPQYPRNNKTKRNFNES